MATPKSVQHFFLLAPNKFMAHLRGCMCVCVCEGVVYWLAFSNF